MPADAGLHDALRQNRKRALDHHEGLPVLAQLDGGHPAILDGGGDAHVFALAGRGRREGFRRRAHRQPAEQRQGKECGQKLFHVCSSSFFFPWVMVSPQKLPQIRPLLTNL